MQDNFISEQRLTSRLMTYWQHIRESAPLPDIVRFNNAAIEDVLQNCCKIRIQRGDGGAHIMHYDFMGREIKNMVGKDLTGKVINHVSAATLEGRICKDVEKCISERVPTYDSGQFFNDKSKMVKYRSCNLPFIHNGHEEIAYVVIGFSCRVF